MVRISALWNWLCKGHRVYGLMLLLALLNGLVYLFLVPPWQHYDEPGHFEFAWLIAHRPGLPQGDTYDQAMRRELAASMVEHHFFAGEKSYPNLISTSQPAWIGLSQISNTPIYHLMISIPLRLVPASDITMQLYLARMVSLLLFLVSVTAAYGIVVELTPPGHPLRWMVPGALALLPGFTDIMTALNDDVGATAFFSLFLWASVVLIRRGFSWPRLAAVLVTALLCFFTKLTVSIAVLLAAIPILFSLLRFRRRRIAWAILAAGGLVALALVFGWGDAAIWYRNSSQAAPTRTSVENAPYGKHALQLYVPAGATIQVFQIIPEGSVEKLQGRTVTLGSWVWASQRVQASSPVLFDGKQSTSKEMEVGKEPVFIAVHAALPEHTNRVRVILQFKNDQKNVPITIYYDGVILVTGKRPLAEAPRFTSGNGSRGSWGGREFSNLIRNFSAESAWPWIRPRAERAIEKYIQGAPSLILGALLDRDSGAWYYRAALKNLFYTFWAAFGWGHVRLKPDWVYPFLAALTLVSAAGCLLALLRRRYRYPADIGLFLAAVCLWMWGAALARGLGSLVSTQFIPGARYAYPAMIPTILLFCLGWLEVIHLIRRLRVPHGVFPLVYCGFFLGLNFLSIYNILQYYLDK